MLCLCSHVIVSPVDVFSVTLFAMLSRFFCVSRRGFASHPASCAYLRSRRMIGSTCSAGAHLGMPPLASNGLRPTSREPGFVFCVWMAMHAPCVLESFHLVFWKVFKSSTGFGKLSCSVLKSFQKLHCRMTLFLSLSLYLRPARVASL
jgi:hypothetical protein